MLYLPHVAVAMAIRAGPTLSNHEVLEALGAHASARFSIGRELALMASAKLHETNPDVRLVKRYCG